MLDRLALPFAILATSARAACNSNDAAWSTGGGAVSIADGAVEATGMCSQVITASPANYKATATGAKRTCRGTTFDSGANLDLSECYKPAAWETDKQRCEPIGEWPETWHTTGASGANVAVTVNCADIDSNLYASGTATRNCTPTGWSDVVTTNCVKAACAAGGDAQVADTFPAAESAVKCGTYSATAYAGDTTNDAERWCYYAPGAVPAWANAFFDDVSACAGTPAACTGSGATDLTNTGANKYTDAACGAYGERNCNAEAATLYKADAAKVKKLCLNGSYTGTVDVSACAKLDTVCPADSVWPLTVASATPVTVACADYDLQYASGNVERLCTAGAWGAVNLAGSSACVKKTCSGAPTGITMAAGFAATDVGAAAAEKQCSEVNALYKVDVAKKVTATCTLDTTTGVASWTNYDTSACEWKDCAISGSWGLTVSGASATANCATLQALSWASGTATRACVDGAWSATIDYSACGGALKCAHAGGFTDAAGASTDIAPAAYAQKSCATYDATNYDATNAFAKKLCWAGDATAGPTLGFLDLSACVVKTTVTTKCAADGVWKETPDTATETILCETLNAELYTPSYDPLVSATVGLATRVCGSTTTVWGTVDVSNCVEKQCALEVDTGSPLSYSWPATNVAAANVADVTATVDCQSYSATFKTGANASRQCKNVSGTPTWQAVDLSLCFCSEIDPGTGFTWADTRNGSSARADCNQFDGVAFVGDTNFATRACTATGFGLVDTSSCTKTAANAVCPAVTVAADKYAAAQGYEGQTVNVACNGITDATYIYNSGAQNAVSQCSGGTWSALAALDTTACTTMVQCPVSTPWPATNVASVSSVFCSDIDADYEADGTMGTRACNRNTAGTAGEWATNVVSSCTWKKCAAASPWPITLHSETKTVLCTVINATLYRAGLASRSCTKGVASAVDVSNCIHKEDLSCMADGNWPISADQAGAHSLACSAHDANQWASGTATRICTKGIWQTPVTSACVALVCATGNGLAESALGVTVATGTCATYLASKYESGLFSATCTAGSWTNYDLSGCVYKKCAAASPWPETLHGANGEVACSTFDATHYSSATEMAKRACSEGAFAATSAIDESGCTSLAAGKTQCAAASPWPATFADESPATLSCSLLGNANYDTSASATRACADGTWAAAVEAACVLKCATVNSWGETNAGVTAQLKCNTHDTTHYTDVATEFATRDCVKGVGNTAAFGAIDESACTTLAGSYKKCTDASEGFPFAWNGATSTLDCAVYDATYVAGTNAVKTCDATGTFGVADVSLCVKKQCAGETTVANGVWALADVGTTATSPCATVFPAVMASGDATRVCGADQVWAAADISACTYKDCIQSGGWLSAANGATQELVCNSYDEIYYDDLATTEKASRVCTNGLWEAFSTIDLATCTTMETGYAKCAENGGFETGVAFTNTADPPVETAQTILANCDTVDTRYKNIDQASRECKAAGWESNDVTNCEWDDCATDGIWGTIASGSTQDVGCSTLKATHYDSATEKATKACAEAAWAATHDESACTTFKAGKSKCAANDHFTATFSGETAVPDATCATYAPELYASGTASVLCKDDATGTFDDVDVSACVLYECAADADKPTLFPATAINLTVEVNCEEFDAAAYVAGAKVSRECKLNTAGDAGEWLVVDVSLCTPASASSSLRPAILTLIFGAAVAATLLW